MVRRAMRRDDDETASHSGARPLSGEDGAGHGSPDASEGRGDAARTVGLVLLLLLAVACRGSEQAAPASGAAAAGSSATTSGTAAAGGSATTSGAAAAGGSAAASGAAGARGSAVAAAGGDAGSAAATGGAAAPRALTLVDEMRALSRTAGDRAKATALHKQALKVHAAHKLAEAERTWAESARADPSWNVPFYNLACATALQTRPLDAIAYLEMVRDRDPSWEMLWRVEHDGELESIRSRPEYEALVIEIEDGIRLRESLPAARGSGSSAGTKQERRPR
jgi:hypothetical protein